MNLYFLSDQYYECFTFHIVLTETLEQCMLFLICDSNEWIHEDVLEIRRTCVEN